MTFKPSSIMLRALSQQAPDPVERSLHRFKVAQRDARVTLQIKVIDHNGAQCEVIQSTHPEFMSLPYQLTRSDPLLRSITGDQVASLKVGSLLHLRCETIARGPIGRRAYIHEIEP